MRGLVQLMFLRGKIGSGGGLGMRTYVTTFNYRQLNKRLDLGWNDKIGN